MPLTQVNNIQLYYEVEGSGEPLILISGLSGDHTAWAKMRPYLTPHYTVITFDNRGVGQSDAPNYPYTSTMMAEDTVALLNHLGCKKAYIVGHSLGAAVGQMIALDQASYIKKLVLAGGFAHFDETGNGFINSRGMLMQTNLPAEKVVLASIPWLYGNHFIADPKNIELAKERVCNNPHPQSLVGYQHQSYACKSHNTLPNLEKIIVPTLILSAIDDLLVRHYNAEYLASKIPNAMLLPLEDCGHMFIIEQAEKTAQHITSFCT